MRNAARSNPLFLASAICSIGARFSWNDLGAGRIARPIAHGRFADWKLSVFSGRPDGSYETESE
jgi:hypothetical protein